MYEARLAVIQMAVRDGTMAFPDYMESRMLERGITRALVAAGLTDDEAIIIEDYPDRARSLVWCPTPSGRPLHVVVTYPPVPITVTTYWPDERPNEWSLDGRRRTS